MFIMGVVETAWFVIRLITLYVLRAVGPFLLRKSMPKNMGLRLQAFVQRLKMYNVKKVCLNADGDLVEEETGRLLATISLGFGRSEFSAELVKRFNNGGTKNEKTSFHACGCGRVHCASGATGHS
jgi:hypothetical protein